METLQIFPDVADELCVTMLHARANAHLHRFVDQCLEVCCLPRAWRSVLFKMLNKIYLHLRPSQMQKKSDKMDIRAYVKIKCVPGAGLGDCFFEHGVIFSKNVAHKDMRNNIVKPRILLLRFAIEYSKDTFKMASFEVLEAQELEALKNFVNMLVSCKPVRKIPLNHSHHCYRIR